MPVARNVRRRECTSAGGSKPLVQRRDIWLFVLRSLEIAEAKVPRWPFVIVLIRAASNAEHDLVS